MIWLRKSAARLLFGTLLPALVVCGATAQEAEPQRKAAPTPQDQEAALAEVRSLFQKEFAAARTIPQQMAVAQKIVETARASGDDATGQYVLYRVARDIAARCNDVDALVEIILEAEGEFTGEGVRFRLDGLAGAIRGANLPSKKLQLAELFEGAVEEAVAAENFDQARAALDHAQTLSRGANDKELPKRLAEREKLLARQEELFKLAEAAIDKADPNDQAGLLAVGKYLAFIKRDTKAGLELLAKSADPALAAQARLDAANPEEPTQVVAIADGWWQLADKYPELAGGMKDRALELYRAALPGLSGLTKTKVENRLNALDGGGPAKKQTPWTVVFRAANPKLWNTDYRAQDGFAMSLAGVPKTIKYLRLAIPGKQSVSAIIEMTPERLTQRSMNGNVGWEGTKLDNWGGVHLGIYHEQILCKERGLAVIAEKQIFVGYGGWGFGHIYGPNQPCCAWAGKLLPAGTVFEIALSPGPLSRDEEKVLVK